ncbi:MAG: glycosyltransferase [Myxococcaceae bacterium]|nr:glycosyltransferase [Myxococcaceae bacterium]
MPSISVLLPARDAEATVSTAARCILEQSFGDLELIAVDDGSVDATRARLLELADARVKVLDGGGRGLVHALNLALGHARGRWVARMDADDECHRSRLELSLAKLNAEPKLVGVGTQVEIFRDDRPVSPNLAAYGAWLNGLTDPALLYRDRFVESPLCHGSVLLERAALERVGGWADGDFPEDWELWLRLLEGGAQLSCVPHVLYRWRDHDRRLTRTDRRYALEAQAAMKARYLAARHRRLIIAGAGRTGLQLSRLLRKLGVELERFIDVNPKKVGTRIEGIAVVGPDDLGPFSGTHLVAAAGSKGARAEIRRHLAGLGWFEGDHFTCAA